MLRPEPEQQGRDQGHAKTLPGEEQTDQGEQDADRAQDGEHHSAAALIPAKGTVTGSMHQMAQGNDAREAAHLSVGGFGSWMQEGVGFGEGPEFVAVKGPVAQAMEPQRRRQENDGGTEQPQRDATCPHPCVLRR